MLEGLFRWLAGLLGSVGEFLSWVAHGPNPYWYQTRPWNLVDWTPAWRTEDLPENVLARAQPRRPDAVFGPSVILDRTPCGWTVRLYGDEDDGQFYEAYFAEAERSELEALLTALAQGEETGATVWTGRRTAREPTRTEAEFLLDALRSEPGA